MENGRKQRLTRRELLLGAGKLAGATAVAGLGATSAQAEPAAVSTPWDYETDVVCVGSGAAACSAAVAAADRGAKVIMVEKMPLTGGTTGKSGGVAWIPNHRFFRAQGVVDGKDDCLRYLARYSYPQLYTPDSPTLGLPARSYRLLEAFYDNGWRMLDRLHELGAVRFKEFNMWVANRPATDYADHLPENKVPRGRAIEPDVGGGASIGGASLVNAMETWLRQRDVPILTGHRVSRIVKEGKRVVGIEARNGDKLVRIRARRGVVFGTGGYSHNTELVNLHQPGLLGACAKTGSTGDFITLATEAGARMGSLDTAWRAQVVLDEALENRAVGRAADVLPGDSMIFVNKYGRRVVNEKRNYNDRTRVHFIYDPVREEYPNQLLFMVFDHRSLDAFGGNFPIPADTRESRFMIRGATIGELAANIAKRLAALAAKTGGVRLASDFLPELKATIERFNGYALAGRDPEFERGLHAYDNDWHLLFSARRPGSTQPPNRLPRICMHPFAGEGPYYAFILGAGALDTNSGPLINEKAEVLGHDDQPIPGLYGAGNCIASPARGAYWGAGATIGLALTFGYIAGSNAATAPAAT